LREAQVANVDPAPYPTGSLAIGEGPAVRRRKSGLERADGFIYANGGTNTTKNSLMEKHAVNLQTDSPG